MGPAAETVRGPCGARRAWLGHTLRGLRGMHRLSRVGNLFVGGVGAVGEEYSLEGPCNEMGQLRRQRALDLRW